MSAVVEEKEDKQKLTYEYIRKCYLSELILILYFQYENKFKKRKK